MRFSTQNEKLHYYIETRQYDLAKKALIDGADVNGLSTHGVTPLIAAVGNKDMHAINLLSQYGVDVNLISRNGNSPLYLAVRSGSVDSVKALLSLKANANAVGIGPHILFEAISTSHEIVKLLIDHQVDVNFIEKSGCTAFTTSIREGELKSFEYLIAAGCDINHKNKGGFTPLMISSSASHEFGGVMSRRLISLGVNIEDVDNAGKTALMNACSYDCIETANILLDLGADVNTLDHDGSNTLMMASGCYCPEFISRLIDLGLSVNDRNKLGMTALMFTSGNSRATISNSRLIPFLIENGADIDAAVLDGDTTLMLAIKDDDVKSAKLLIELGANLHLENNNGLSALQQARNAGNNYIAEMISAVIEHQQIMDEVGGLNSSARGRKP